MPLSAEDKRLMRLREEAAKSQVGSGINKSELYGEFSRAELDNRNRQEWRDRLYRKAAHKSLDIPDPEAEEMGDISVSHVKNGIGLKEILATGALVLGGIGLWQAPALLAAFRALQPIPAQPAPVAPQPGTSTTIERDYEIGPVKIEPPSLFEGSVE
jgi:hypothetical protein